MIDATVVIPTFNGRTVLQRTLLALGAVDYPSDRWEVIVVDDGSSDGTRDAVSRWAVDTRFRLTCLTQTNAGPASARNRGAEAARGDVVIFIDNDIEVPPAFVRAHVDTLASHPGCWVVGRVVHPGDLRTTPFGRYRDDMWERFHAGHPSDRIAETAGMTAANLSMPRRDFLRLEGFDPSFTIASCEDWELGLRARRHGIRVLYHPGIVVLHNDWAGSLSRFCERQRLYSISDVLLWRKYGAESPRYQLVRQNSPIDWNADTVTLTAKKILKRVLASRIGTRVVHLACRLAELIVPDSRLSRKAYDVAVGLAIFQGVREGFKRYRSTDQPKSWLESSATS